jgi:myo-inositol 2-dehydrogenase / D-chiro-inositol 1-dehydrogenase
MTVRIGIIGVGLMGADHARNIAGAVSGAEVVSIYDFDTARAKLIAAELGARTVEESPDALMADKGVDAIVIASPDDTHARLVLAALAVHKPVLCEKPLAPSSAECLEVVAAEVKLGKRLAHVGFMRRFDPSYMAMKAKLKTGELGAALMFHCVHRNVSAPHFFTSDMAIANSAPHEFDIVRYVLDSDVTDITVFQPAAASKGALVKPVFIVMRTASGALIDVEIHNNAGYGYDVKGELVCEKGTVMLRAPVNSEVNVALANSTAFPADHRPRFAEAYRLQNQAWIHAIQAGTHLTDGSSAWDGYVAALTAEAGLRSLAEGKSVRIEMTVKPQLYA